MEPNRDKPDDTSKHHAEPLSPPGDTGAPRSPLLRRGPAGERSLRGTAPQARPAPAEDSRAGRHGREAKGRSQRHWEPPAGRGGEQDGAPRANVSPVRSVAGKAYPSSGCARTCPSSGRASACLSSVSSHAAGEGKGRGRADASGRRTRLRAALQQHRPLHHLERPAGRACAWAGRDRSAALSRPGAAPYSLAVLRVPRLHGEGSGPLFLPPPQGPAGYGDPPGQARAGGAV